MISLTTYAYAIGIAFIVGCVFDLFSELNEDFPPPLPVVGLGLAFLAILLLGAVELVLICFFGN